MGGKIIDHTSVLISEKKISQKHQDASQHLIGQNLATCLLMTSKEDGIVSICDFSAEIVGMGSPHKEKSWSQHFRQKK